MSKRKKSDYILDMTKGSMHRSWIVLGVMAKHDSNIRLMTIVEETGIPYPTLIDLINRLNNGQIPGLVVEKTGNGDYGVKQWSQFAGKAAVIHFYDQVWEQLDKYKAGVTRAAAKKEKEKKLKQKKASLK